MSIPLIRKPSLPPNFTTVNDQNEALKKTTGKSIHELVAEAIEYERQKMLSGTDSKQYIKLLTTVFGKFSVGAPQHVITEEATKPLSREEIRSQIDNYLTRKALSTPAPVVVTGPESETDTED